MASFLWSGHEHGTNVCEIHLHLNFSESSRTQRDAQSSLTQCNYLQWFKYERQQTVNFITDYINDPQNGAAQLKWSTDRYWLSCQIRFTVLIQQSSSELDLSDSRRLWNEAALRMSWCEYAQAIHNELWLYWMTNKQKGLRKSITNILESTKHSLCRVAYWRVQWTIYVWYSSYDKHGTCKKDLIKQMLINKRLKTLPLPFFIQSKIKSIKIWYITCLSTDGDYSKIFSIVPRHVLRHGNVHTVTDRYTFKNVSTFMSFCLEPHIRIRI